MTSLTQSLTDRIVVAMRSASFFAMMKQEMGSFKQWPLHVVNHSLWPVSSHT
jgi:hypothetical protein